MPKRFCASDIARLGILVAAAKKDDKRSTVASEIRTVSRTEEHPKLQDSIGVGKRFHISKIAGFKTCKIRVDAGANHW